MCCALHNHISGAYEHNQIQRYNTVGSVAYTDINIVLWMTDWSVHCILDKDLASYPGKIIIVNSCLKEISYTGENFVKQCSTF